MELLWLNSGQDFICYFLIFPNKSSVLHTLIFIYSEIVVLVVVSSIVKYSVCNFSSGY